MIRGWLAAGICGDIMGEIFGELGVSDKSIACGISRTPTVSFCGVLFGDNGVLVGDNGVLFGDIGLSVGILGGVEGKCRVTSCEGSITSLVRARFTCMPSSCSGLMKLGIGGGSTWITIRIRTVTLRPVTCC